MADFSVCDIVGDREARFYVKVPVIGVAPYLDLEEYGRFPPKTDFYTERRAVELLVLGLIAGDGYYKYLTLPDGFSSKGGCLLTECSF